ncbi:hypothetical protein JXQ31_19785 [candidate division KSB1 bacterium]|nr:hypothetical protein [candidate division KSB1 bacterium]
MKKVFYFMFGLFIFSLIVFCNLNKDPLNTKYDGFPFGNHFVFTDNHCIDNGDALFKLNSRIYLRAYRFIQDTLTLQIHYTANCCPAFVVDVDINDNVVEIAIADTLRACLCICEYNNDFTFLYDKEGVLRVLFKWWDITHTQLSTEMDTTVIVTRQDS